MDKVISSTDKVILPMDKVVLSMDKIWQIKTLSMDEIFLSIDGIYVLQILDRISCIMFSNESLPIVGISYKTFAYKDNKTEDPSVPAAGNKKRTQKSPKISMAQTEKDP